MLITFDLDGVLMLNPFGSGVFPYVRQVISAKAKIAPQEVQKAIIAEARARQLKRNLVSAYDWDDIVRKVSTDFGVKWTESIAELVKSYCEPPHIKLYPGALELLTHLQKEGYHLRSLTNGFRIYQYPVLRALGIAHFFEEIITPEQAGWAKPEPQFYVAARKGRSLPHIHIGDTVIHDVWGANLGGAISIWVRPNLPEGWDLKTPLERAREPLIEELVKEGIRADLCPQCYPELILSEALPAFVINHLDEVNDVIKLIEQEQYKKQA